MRAAQLRSSNNRETTRAFPPQGVAAEFVLAWTRWPFILPAILSETAVNDVSAAPRAEASHLPERVASRIG